jgi:KDO2-lipid IV(A) lauroyltransferase
LLKILAWLAGRLSPAGVRRWGAVLGWLAWILGLRRRVAVRNIETTLGLGRRAARRLARRGYRHLGQAMVEFLAVGSLDREAARRILGEEPLQRVDGWRRGRGVLVLGAHLGNWDLLACAAARAGLPVNVVTRELKSSWLNRFWMAQREACGVRLLPAVGSARAVVHALRRNEVVALVLDQHEPGGLVVPFLGRPAATSAAMARLARATGAPVVPAFLLRGGDGYRARVLDPVSLRRTEDPRRDHWENTAHFSRIIEQEVRARPAQWFWVHRRWKVGAGPSVGAGRSAGTPDPVSGR